MYIYIYIYGWTKIREQRVQVLEDKHGFTEYVNRCKSSNNSSFTVDTDGLKAAQTTGEITMLAGQKPMLSLVKYNFIMV